MDGIEYQSMCNKICMSADLKEGSSYSAFIVKDTCLYIIFISEAKSYWNSYTCILTANMYHGINVTCIATGI
jgi:hypothetical protein